MTMTPKRNTKSLFHVLGGIAMLAVLIAAAVLSGRFAKFLDLYGLAFVVIGGIALILTSYNLREIAAALRSAGRAKRSDSEGHKYLIFWESASRNFWMVGVLATFMSFVIALTNSETIQGIAIGMASSLIPSAYGMILSVICLVPWLKLKETRSSNLPEEISGENEKTQERSASSFSFENMVGYVLIMAIILWTLIKAELSSHSPILPIWKCVVYWPALLFILGGTIALVLFVGSSAKGRIWTLGFAVTGLIGSFLGIIQALLGISWRHIQGVAAAVTFILSSCFFSLLGMMLVAAPLEDRSIKDSKKARHSTLSRAAWYVFPIVTLILLVITFIIVVTPVRK